MREDIGAKIANLCAHRPRLVVQPMPDAGNLMVKTPDQIGEILSDRPIVRAAAVRGLAARLAAATTESVTDFDEEQ